MPNLEIPKNARVFLVFTWFFINFRSFHFVSVSDTISVPTTSLKQGRHLGAAGCHLGLSPLIGVHVFPKGGRRDPALRAESAAIGLSDLLACRTAVLEPC